METESPRQQGWLHRGLSETLNLKRNAMDPGHLLRARRHTAATTRATMHNLIIAGGEKKSKCIRREEGGWRMNVAHLIELQAALITARRRGRWKMLAVCEDARPGAQ